MNEIIISTVPKPDILSVEHFKKNIKKYLRKGFKPHGQLKINSDGSLIQKFIKASK